MTTLNNCDCGCNDPHVIANRQTCDGRTVKLWSDGLLSWGLGAIAGIGIARECWAQEADIRAGWALMGELCTIDADEVVKAYRALRRVYRQPYDYRCSWRMPQSNELLPAAENRRIIASALK